MVQVGIDEAGRGPLLGPLVVAGVAIEDQGTLRELGVRDSKKLTAARRTELAAQILSVASATASVVLSAADIDDGRRHQTLNELEMSAFVAIGRRLRAERYILDAADVEQERFGREFARGLDRNPAPTITSMHKADAVHPVVSAASILAKVERDRHVEQISLRLQRILNRPMGSGYPSDQTTVEFLHAYVEQEGELPGDVRASWMPVRRLMALRRTRPLTEF